MNQNYVRKCEEYLQNIPSQKLPPSSTSASAAGVGGHRPGPNLSSRKLTQPGGLRQGRQSINKAATPPPPAEGSRPKPKPTPPPPPTPAGGRRTTPARPPTARPGQLGSKFIRPCCRPTRHRDSAERAGRRGSDNVNQNDDVRVMDGTAGAGGGEGEGRTTGKTKTWDGILTAESTVETAGSQVASLTQIKSKATSPFPTEPSPITSQFPHGAAPDSSTNHQRGGLTLAPNPSVTSLSTVSSVRPASSSIAAVPPQPRSSSTVLATPPVVTEHVLQQQQPSSKSIAKAEVNQQLQGINLFRFDPLRTLQFLTLELKSKLKPLLLTMPGGGAGNEDATSAHKQLYKISKELLYAVKILTENVESQRKRGCSCGGGDKETSDGKILINTNNCGASETSGECQNCLKLQSVLDCQRLPAEQPGSCLPRKKINYPQDQPDSSKASTTDQQQQLQLRLEGEIKRLQTMISDKQTTTVAAATEGLINDLNRKLDEATHARDEAQRELLYATLENERLNFLLRSQCSTMANLRHDFSAIQSLAGQQIDLLDRTNEHGGLNDRSRSKSNAIATATTTVTIGGNHHRNYRYPSGSAAPLSPNQPTAGEQVAKLRHSHHRHYSVQNIAEKESDGGNDAANDYYWKNSASQSQQQQQLQQPPQEPEVMLRLPSSTLMVEGGGAFQQHREEKPPTGGLWQRKNRAATAELEQSGTSSGSSSSLLAVVNATRSTRFGPTKRALLIDSDRDDGLKEEDQHQHSSSSLSSLTSSQQQQQRRRGRGHRERKDDLPIDNNSNNGKDIRKGTISNREVPAFGDKPFIISRKENDAENCFDYTNNSSHPVQSSKTNDCVSFAPKDDGMATNRRQQQLGPGAGGSKKKDDDDDTLAGHVEAKGKYPRDYGDKFERRESLLAALAVPGQDQAGKELCQNRPIMGQIRRRSSVEAGKKQEEKEVLVGKIISAASGQTRRTTTEEFSIDFDDITLPPSPIPFRRRDQGAGLAEEEEFPSSFGDWM
uniref:Uncharacterized protein n=1 Tax=Culex tarsalis TaxID=7177 RepID=A0A1Q3G211_CULTA